MTAAVSEPINPGGWGGWGVVVKCGDEVLWEKSGLIKKAPDTTNNVAEYTAFLETLKWLLQSGLADKRIVFHSDSRLVVCQMFGWRGRKWKIKKGHYVPLAIRAKGLLAQFSDMSGIWIPREENGAADKLSKKMLIEIGVEFRIQPNEEDTHV